MYVQNKFSPKLHDETCLEKCFGRLDNNCKGCSDAYLQARRLYLSTLTPKELDVVLKIERGEA